MSNRKIKNKNIKGNELTDNKKILQDDTTFKFVFSNKVFLQLFISEFFNFIKDNHIVNIDNAIPQGLIFPSNSLGHEFYGDLVVTTTSGDIISLELYQNNFTKREYNKSYAYKCQLYANQMSKDDNLDYQNFKRVISINLINGNFRKTNNNIVNKYSFKENRTLNEIDDGNTFIYLIRLDLVAKLSYTNINNKFIKLLKLFDAESIKELKEFTKGDNDLMKIVNYIKKWKKQIDDKKKYINEVKYNAREDGKELGKEIGKELGKEEANIDVAKTMLADGVSVDNVQKYTKLPKAKIMSLL